MDVCARPSLAKDRHHLIKRLFALGNSGHGRMCRRIADGQDHHGLFRRWPAAHFGQEFHRVGGVFKANKARVMDGGDQHSRGNANAFGHVIILIAVAIVCQAIALGKHHDQPRGVGQVWLVDARADGFQRRQPFIARAPE